jgi:hypothetical protein
VKHTFQGRVLPVVVGATVLITGANIASYAADGHPFHLGGRNHESHTTTLVNSGNGPAFRFETAGDSAPFAVSSETKVAHLNAARVGGLRPNELSRSYRYVLPGNTTLPNGFQATDLPPGRYDVSFNLAIGDDTDEPTPAFCFVPDSRHEFAVVAQGSGDLGGGQVLNASGSVTVDKTGEAGLICESSGTLDKPAGSEFRNLLTFTRVQAVRRGTVGPLGGGPMKRAQKDAQEFTRR